MVIKNHYNFFVLYFIWHAQQHVTSPPSYPNNVNNELTQNFKASINSIKVSPVNSTPNPVKLNIKQGMEHFFCWFWEENIWPRMYITTASFQFFVNFLRCSNFHLFSCNEFALYIIKLYRIGNKLYSINKARKKEKKKKKRKKRKKEKKETEIDWVTNIDSLKWIGVHQKMLMKNVHNIWKQCLFIGRNISSDENGRENDLGINFIFENYYRPLCGNAN